MYLISPHKPQYKANLHCHSTLSDGKLTPQQLKDIYKNHGYHILAITDHETPKNHSAMTEPDFLMLTGYECYIRSDPECRYNLYASEIHMNFFAKEPGNETLVCYNPAFCKYLSSEQQEALVKAGSQRTREYTPEYINEVIRTAVENGYLVAYNHPYWSMESEADILAYKGYFSLEIVNYGSYSANFLDHNGPLYDKMLRAGMRVFCHGADDNHNDYPLDHPRSDSFGAFTMILAEELSYGKVIEAMETGEMYSSMGPVFQEISFNDGMLHIECSEVSSIHAYFGSKAPAISLAAPGETLTSADFKMPAKAAYVRISVRDREGRWADTRGFTRQELGLPPLA